MFSKIEKTLKINYIIQSKNKLVQTCYYDRGIYVNLFKIKTLYYDSFKVIGVMLLFHSVRFIQKNERDENARSRITQNKESYCFKTRREDK